MDKFADDYQQQRLLAKLNRRYGEYRQAVERRDRMSQQNALKALLDECRTKELFFEFAQQFVKQHLNLSYGELLRLKRKRYI